jgi:uncharacterized protein YbjT (DUF2867 family)
MPLAEPDRIITVIGGTGCVGSALVRDLASRPNVHVRVMSRRRPAISPTGCELVTGNVCDGRSLDVALRGTEVAYYLVHCLGAPNFAELDRRAASVFADAAARARVRRIVYLGALGDDTEALSPHIQSRQEVGRILRAGDVPVVELRAAVVLAARSAVFELLRDLTERIPILIVPKGAERRCQPIALDDIVRWLIAAADHPEMPGPPLEVGGAEITTYAELMRLYATLRGLFRPALRMPIAVPRLSGWWIGRFSRVPGRVGRELVLGLGHDAIVRDTRARRIYPFQPLSLREALQRAIEASPRGEAPC